MMGEILNDLSEFLNGALIVSCFFIIYFGVRNICFQLLKYYFVIVEMILIWITVRYFMENEVLDLGMLILLIFYQGLLIYFVKVDYPKDSSRQKIYFKISHSHFLPVMIIGIQEIKCENIDCFVETLNYLLDTHETMKKKAFCFFEYEENYITFRALFLKQSDMNMFIEGKDLLEFEIENIGKGGSLEVRYQYHDLYLSLVDHF